MRRILAACAGYTQDKDAYLKRLRRIEGQVRGLQRMVEEDVYCIDVLTQVSAVTRALQAVALGLLEEHLGHCVTEAVQAGGEEGRESVEKALHGHLPAGQVLITDRAAAPSRVLGRPAGRTRAGWPGFRRA